PSLLVLPTSTPCPTRRSSDLISSAEATYYSTSGNGNYGTFAYLMTQSLVDSVLGSGLKSGYNFAVTIAAGTSTTSFVGGAAPVTDPKSTRLDTRHHIISYTVV